MLRHSSMTHVLVLTGCGKCSQSCEFPVMHSKSLNSVPIPQVTEHSPQEGIKDQWANKKKKQQ